MHSHIHLAVFHIHLHSVLLHQIFRSVLLFVTGHCRCAHFHIHFGHLFHHCHLIGPVNSFCRIQGSLAQAQRSASRAILCRGRHLQGTLGNGNDNIIGLGNTKKETSFGNRFHIDTITGDHHRVAATEIHPIIGGSGGINKTKPHFFARLEFWIFRQNFPIGQKCRIIDIGYIRTFHTVSPKLELSTKCTLFDDPPQRNRRTFFYLIPLIPALKVSQYVHWFFVGPVREYHDQILIIFQCFFLGLNHNGAINTLLFLEHRMRMVPVGTRLVNGYSILKSGSRFYWGCGQIGNPIIKIGEYQSVPVYRCFNVHFIGYVDDGQVAFGKFQDWAGNTTIDGHPVCRYPSKRYFIIFQNKTVFLNRSPLFLSILSVSSHLGEYRRRKQE